MLLFRKDKQKSNVYTKEQDMYKKQNEERQKQIKVRCSSSDQVPKDKMFIILSSRNHSVFDVASYDLGK